VCVYVCNTISNFRCQIPSVIDSTIDAECRVPQLDVRSVEKSKDRPTTVEETTIDYGIQSSC
jgi:hypothetical protein